MSRKTCAIVGAGEGLGRALAERFARGGMDLALISRSEAGSLAAAEAARAHGAETRFFAGDATEPQSIEAAVREAEAAMGPVDVLIYNVRDSFTRCAPLEMSYEDLEQVFRLEVAGAFAAAKAVLPAMIERSAGTLLFSSATAALRGSAEYPLYAIGKFGLRALSQSLAKAYAKDGVHVAHIRLDCDLDVPVMRELYGDKFDAEKMAKPEDIAETYWWVYQQPKSAWSNEVELRPYTESWTI